MRITTTDEYIYIEIIQNTQKETYIQTIHEKLENKLYSTEYKVWTKPEFHARVDDAIYNLLKHGVLYSIDGKICMSFNKVQLGADILTSLKKIPTLWE